MVTEMVTRVDGTKAKKTDGRYKEGMKVVKREDPGDLLGPFNER